MSLRVAVAKAERLARAWSVERSSWLTSSHCLSAVIAGGLFPIRAEVCRILGGGWAAVEASTSRAQIALVAVSLAVACLRRR